MATSLKDLEEQIAGLTQAEKAQVVQRLALEIVHAWPGIEKTPGVAGGDACVVRTRIPVWTLESYRRLGWSEAQILDNFSTLCAADLVNAWAYADAHRDEIEQAMRENDEAERAGQAMPDTRSRWPRSIGIGRSGRGEVGERAEELLAEVCKAMK